MNRAAPCWRQLKMKNWKSRIIYGSVSGLVYALVIALLDYFNDEEFDLRKFILGLLIFGIVMMIIAKIRKPKNKE